MKQETEERYLRIRGAAKYIGVSERSIHNLMRRRAIPFVRLSRRIVLFDREDLDRALQRYRIKMVGEGLS